MRHVQPSYREPVPPPGEFALHRLRVPASAQVSCFEWVGVTLKTAATGYVLCAVVCVRVRDETTYQYITMS